MENLFIPHEQALAIKELGFDEPCMGRYDKADENIIFKTSHYHTGRWNYLSHCISAPLYQQTFDRLRETHKIHGEVTSCYKLNEQNNPCGNEWQIYTYELSKLEDGKCDEEVYADYEIARLECLKKLILILKTKQ